MNKRAHAEPSAGPCGHGRHTAEHSAGGWHDGPWNVHGGLKARLNLSAWSSRLVPKIPGIVRTVSADRLTDEATRQPYYLARVAVDRPTLQRMAPGIDLLPGMPVEVLVVTERRTMIDYLLRPFDDALWHNFREICRQPEAPHVRDGP